MLFQKLFDQFKRARNFISFKGFFRYCIVIILLDGSIVLNGCRLRRGKLRGLLSSKEMVIVLKGCEDLFFLDFMKRCLDWDLFIRMILGQVLRYSWLRRRLLKFFIMDSRVDFASRRKLIVNIASVVIFKFVSGISSGKGRNNIIIDDMFALMYNRIRLL